MVARVTARTLSRRGVHYGWVIVAVTFLTSLSTAGAVGLAGVFIAPLAKEFGWDTASISSAFAIRLLLFGLMAPFAAAFMERYGLRRVILTALALVTVGLLLGTAVTELWQLVVLWGFVVGIGTGLTAMVLGATVASRWFVERRGLVLGILTAAVATGQLVFLPLAAHLIEAVGWRLALVPNVAGLVLAAVLVALFLRDRPSDVGLTAFGAPPEPAGGVVPAAAAPGGSVFAAVGRAFSVLAESSRSPAFWILFSTFFICGLSTAGLIQTHFVSLCADFGMPQTDAAATLAMMGAFDFVGTILSGWLSDRYSNRWLLFWYYGLRGLSLLWLPHSTFSFYGLSLFALFYGLDWIATVPPTVKLAGQTFGAAKAPLVFGWIFTGHQIGAAVAAYGAGLSRTAWDTYLPAFYAAGFTCLIAAGLVLLLKPKARQPAAAPVPATAPAAA
ncbi:MFS transporter [Chelatococcus reniformis]|uniref:MFS transporter n=1 Tax=Chelatococcus reniformis TaxID=1494448 RepID=A0A916UP29_9HYPH|nr:MFS transporter [Chelatococcus reniformis]GGC80946.1 MFS transporter [Chelatococcus reniformis]